MNFWKSCILTTSYPKSHPIRHNRPLPKASHNVFSTSDWFQCTSISKINPVDHFHCVDENVFKTCVDFRVDVHVFIDREPSGNHLCVYNRVFTLLEVTEDLLIATQALQVRHSTYHNDCNNSNDIIDKGKRSCSATMTLCSLCQSLLNQKKNKKKTLVSDFVAALLSSRLQPLSCKWSRKKLFFLRRIFHFCVLSQTLFPSPVDCTPILPPPPQTA